MHLAELIVKYEPLVTAKLALTEHQTQVFDNIANCRTPVLGGHWYTCPHCGAGMMLYNSCRNRNCPTCQGNRRQQWLERNCANLLNVPYYHVVFTVPEILNRMFLYRPKIMYDVLFQATWQTLSVFFADPRFFGGQGGMLSMLHSWGQTLVLHPHLHCIVPGAGLDAQGNFRILKTKDKYLFPVKALSKVFRAKFAAQLTQQATIHNFEISKTVRSIMFEKPWVVYCKRPFASPRHILAYLARYAYRTAIAESRILADENGKITFRYKDYKTNGQQKTMALTAEEFLRRFAMHILPKRMVRIRHFGVLSNSNKKEFTAKASTIAGLFNPKTEPTLTKSELDDATDPSQKLILCPVCKTGYLRKMLQLAPKTFDLGFSIVSTSTGEFLFCCHSRDGPHATELTFFVP